MEETFKCSLEKVILDKIKSAFIQFFYAYYNVLLTFSYLEKNKNLIFLY